MRYIDAEKLKAKVKELNLATKTYEEQVAFNNALAMVVEIIDSLQQEQPHFAGIGKMEQPESGGSEKPNDQQQEVDLEKEINNAGMAMTNHNPSWKEIECFARHFYELGLNTRKKD